MRCARLKFTADGLVNFHRDDRETRKAPQPLLF